MRRLAVVAAFLLAPAATAAVPGSDGTAFPLRLDNTWTYEDLDYGGESTLDVARGRTGTFVLEGFPGANDLRVRWSGTTLQAWDAGDRRWEPLLRLGARGGTTYEVELPQPLWNGVRVTVATKRGAVRNAVLRRTFPGVVKLRIQPDPDLADAGLTELDFAPRVGLVRWVEESIAGPVVHVLSGGRVSGKTIG
jgi:hypothetical protein